MILLLATMWQGLKDGVRFLLWGPAYVVPSVPDEWVHELRWAESRRKIAVLEHEVLSPDLWTHRKEDCPVCGRFRKVEIAFKNELPF